MENKEKHYAFYVLNERLKEYHQNLVSLEQGVNELKNLKEGIDSLKDAKVDEEIFVSLGQGIFVKAILKDEDLLMNVGEDVLVKKTKKGANSIIDNQIREMGSIIENLKKEIQSDVKKLESLKEEIEKDNK